MRGCRCRSFSTDAGLTSFKDDRKMHWCHSTYRMELAVIFCPLQSGMKEQCCLLHAFFYQVGRRYSLSTPCLLLFLDYHIQASVCRCISIYFPDAELLSILREFLWSTPEFPFHFHNQLWAATIPKLKPKFAWVHFFWKCYCNLASFFRNAVSPILYAPGFIPVDATSECV